MRTEEKLLRKSPKNNKNFSFKSTSFGGKAASETGIILLNGFIYDLAVQNGSRKASSRFVIFQKDVDCEFRRTKTNLDHDAGAMVSAIASVSRKPNCMNTSTQSTTGVQISV
jgi:hypothetical protein